MNSTLTRLASIARPWLLAAAALAALPAASRNHEVVVPPLSPGRFAVACSNIAQDAALIEASGGVPSDFWEGQQVDGRPRYISEVLAHPGAAFNIAATVPDIRRIYPGNAGDVVEFVGIVCHPTMRDNPDPHYALPDGSGMVPHMLPPGEAPRLISISEYWSAFGVEFSPPVPGPMQLPVIVYSHGLGGSPIGKGYIEILTQLAAQGYMVVAVFHGDPRFSRVRLDDLGDYWYALTNFDRIVEMMLMRPVSLKAALDTLLADPGYAPGVDAERIGGFGASMGGQAMAHLLGARITSRLDGSRCDEPVRDTRIKAAVGYVPYSGQSWLTAFCANQHGAGDVDRPYLAITGSDDVTAPEKMTEQAVNRFRGSRYLVSLPGGKHELRAEDAGDLFTWMITFLNAYMEVPADPGAMARLIRMARVEGGRDENVVIDVHVPRAFDAALRERPALEFHNTILDHYFVAAGEDEVDIILAGGAGPGWELTGESFKVHEGIPPELFATLGPVCRFYGNPPAGPNSHFFTASMPECDFVRETGGWLYEGIGFYVHPLPAGGCPPGFLQVMRAYNDRFVDNDSNHRYSTSDSTMREMARRGWIVEGTVWCARP